MNGTAIEMNYNDFKVDKLYYLTNDCTGDAYISYSLSSSARLPAGKGLVFVDNRADSMVELSGDGLQAFAINNSSETPYVEINSNSYNSSTRVADCSQDMPETINAIPVSQSAITIDWDWLESLMPLQGRY